MLRVVLVIVACAACAELPDRPRDVRGGDHVLVTDDGSGVKTPTYELTFAQLGVRLPTSLTFRDTDEVLESDRCPEPSLAGVSLAPMATAVGGLTAPDLVQAANTLVVEKAGPAVVQIVVSYEVPYTCGDKQTFGGSSRFTLFPSGRILRQDAVTPTNASSPLSTASCGGCGGSGVPTTFNTFWTFAAGGARSEVDLTGNLRVLGQGEEGQAAVSCVHYAGHTVGLAWSSGGTPRALDENGPLAYSYEFFPATTTIANGFQLAASMLFLTDAAPCDEVLDRMFLPDLVADDGAPRPLELDGEYIYAHPDRVDGEIRLRTADGSGFTEGFAVRLNLGGTPEHLRVERSSGQSVDYLVQDDAGQTIIWVAGGIAAGDAVIVEAL